MSATAIVRFWTLVMAAYTFLDERRDRLQQQLHGPLTTGQARREMQRRHRRHLLQWLRHAMYYLAWLETEEPKLEGSQESMWFERLEQEQDNLRTARSGRWRRGSLKETCSWSSVWV